MLKKVLTILIVMLMFVTLVGVSNVNKVYAEDDPACVVRSDKDHDKAFLGDAPIGTITIPSSGMTEKSPHFSYNSTTEEITQYDVEGVSRSYNKAIVWAPNGLVHDQLVISEGDTVVVDGEVTFKWEGLATLQDGSKADVEMTVSEITFYQPKADILAPITIFKTNGYIGPYDNIDPTVEDDHGTGEVSTAMKATVNVKITKDGSPVSGTVLFSTNDLDNAGGSYGTDYAEGFTIKSGALSNVYIPNDNNLIIVDNDCSDGNPTNLRLYDDPESGTENPPTYITGFVLLADAANGITLEWTGQGSGMGTKLFTGNISHKIISTTTKGGNIQTTVNGNSDGKLDDGTDVLGPGQLDVPDGKTVVYTMTPEPGYKLDKVVVDGQEITPTKHTNDDGSVYYTFEFPENEANHTIDVSWEPCDYSIEYDANGGEGTMDPQDFTGADETMKSKDNAFTREGYHFTGFKALDKDGNPVKDKDGKELPLFETAEDFKAYLIALGDGAKITLQAQWEPDEYTIKYDPNGGEGTMTEQHFSGTDKEAKSKPNEFTAGGFDFMGFKAKDKNGNYLKDKDGNDLVFANPADFISYLKKQGNGGEITLVAQWRKKEYKSPIPKTGVE